MATQVSLNSGAVASAGALALQTNGTTEAVSISTGQVATLAQNPILTSGTANGVAYLNGSKALTTGSALVFDGTNLGIGTSSPSYKLQVAGTSGTLARFNRTSTGSGLDIGADGSGAVIQPYSVDAIQFYNAAGTTLNAIINSSGNLGLGVTPGAWRTDYSTRAMQFGPVGAVYSLSAGTTNNQTFLSSNLIFGSGGTYSRINADWTTLYQQADGKHLWYTSAAQTGSVSMSQLMTLDASGNLMVGTTTATSKVTVGGTSDVRVTINETSGSVRTDLYSQTGTGGVGTQSNHPFQLFTNGSERARIDTSGNLLVGTTSNPGVGKIGIQFTQSTNQAIALQNTSVSNSGNYINFYNSSGTLQGYIGQTNSTTTAYATSSDYRLKENVQPMTGALAKIVQLNPCTYIWKDNGFEGEGFIAHELAEVCPQAVMGEKDAVDANGNPVYQGIDTSFLVATLTAALQEAHGLIKDLQTRVAALES